MRLLQALILLGLLAGSSSAFSQSQNWNRFFCGDCLLSGNDGGEPDPETNTFLRSVVPQFIQNIPVGYTVVVCNGSVCREYRLGLLSWAIRGPEFPDSGRDYLNTQSNFAAMGGSCGGGHAGGGIINVPVFETWRIVSAGVPYYEVILTGFRPQYVAGGGTGSTQVC